MMRTKTIIAILGVGIVFASCNSDKRKPGFTYMDDMYNSPALETYSADENSPNEASVLTPVDGTIPRGYDFYDLPNTPEGYAQSKTITTFPEAYATDEALANGKELYGIFCTHCHGKNGDGQGTLVEREKILGVPSYSTEKLPDITPSSVYHVIMYGKGIMGSHASQLTEQERWEIIRYVWELRGEEVSSPEAESTTEEVQENQES